MGSNPGTPLPAWFKAVLAVNTGLIVAGMAAGARIAWTNESRLAVVEHAIVSLKSGRLIKMADETRARFVDVEDRIRSVAERQRELGDDMDTIRESIILLREGIAELRARTPEKRSEAEPEEREPLPTLVPAPEGLGG